MRCLFALMFIRPNATYAGPGSSTLLEDREDHSLEIYLTRLGEDPTDFWGADAYKYTLCLSEE